MKLNIKPHSRQERGSSLLHLINRWRYISTKRENKNMWRSPKAATATGWMAPSTWVVLRAIVDMIQLYCGELSVGSSSTTTNNNRPITEIFNQWIPFLDHSCFMATHAPSKIYIYTIVRNQKEMGQLHLSAVLWPSSVLILRRLHGCGGQFNTK